MELTLTSFLGILGGALAVAGFISKHFQSSGLQSVKDEIMKELAKVSERQIKLEQLAEDVARLKDEFRRETNQNKESIEREISIIRSDFTTLSDSHHHCQNVSSREATERQIKLESKVDRIEDRLVSVQEQVLDKMDSLASNIEVQMWRKFSEMMNPGDSVDRRPRA